MIQGKHSSLYQIAMYYLRFMNVHITETTLKTSLEENPYFPSLYSLSNVFHKFKIESQAFEVDLNRLDQVEPPFVTLFYQRYIGKDFVLVTKLSKESVWCVGGNGKEKAIDRKSFEEGFRNIAFIAERSNKSGEVDYMSSLQSEKRRRNTKVRLIGAIVLVLALSLFYFINTISTSTAVTILLLLTKLLGITAASLLLVYEIDKANFFVKNICTAGKQLSCDSVINSKAGRLFNISWSEIGFFYFASTALILFFTNLAIESRLLLLGIASALVAPYILFSLYYQWKVVKRWCILCLWVQFILLFELLISLYVFRLFTENEMWLTISSIILPPKIMQLLICLLLPIVAWYLLRPFFLAAKNSHEYNTAYKRLLYNPDIFNGLLQQKQDGPEMGELGLRIGNLTASNTITKVCNPYCGPCSKAHSVLEELIHKNEDFNIRIIFTATNKEDDRGAIVVKHLLLLNEQSNPEKTAQALNDWYTSSPKNYEAFAEKYPVKGELALQKNNIEAMSEWCKEAGITHTPTIFVNGKRLPENYRIEELKNIF